MYALLLGKRTIYREQAGMAQVFGSEQDYQQFTEWVEVATTRALVSFVADSVDLETLERWTARDGSDPHHELDDYSHCAARELRRRIMNDAEMLSCVMAEQA